MIDRFVSRHRYRGGAFEGERALTARDHAEGDAPVERKVCLRRRLKRITAVSYTHLTLPTILRV